MTDIKRLIKKPMKLKRYFHLIIFWISLKNNAIHTSFEFMHNFFVLLIQKSTNYVTLTQLEYIKPSTLTVILAKLPRLVP